MKYLKIIRTAFRKYECGKVEDEKVPVVGVGYNAEMAVRAYFQEKFDCMVKLHSSTESNIELSQKLSIAYKFSLGKHYISKDFRNWYEIELGGYVIRDVNGNLYIAKVLFPNLEVKNVH